MTPTTGATRARHCVLCAGTWNVSGLDNLCEDCGMRLATIDRHNDLEAQLVRAVSVRDGWQCTCTGACGRLHPPVTGPFDTTGQHGPGEPADDTIATPTGRCPVGTGSRPVQLWVVRTDPTASAVEWWRLPAAAAATFCEACAPDTGGQTSDTPLPDTRTDGAR